MTCRRFLAAIAAVSGLLAAGAGRAADQPVDLELIISVDVSWSVDAEEAQLQRNGYVAAFTDPQVVEAIRSGFLGRVAVLYHEWAGMGHNRIVADWTVIEDEATAKAFAAKLSRQRFDSAYRTSISDAIDFAAPMFESNGYAGRRRVIDISGDGANNSGRLVNMARDEAVARGITINGLPIMERGVGAAQRMWVADLDLYFENCVIGGRGAFMVVANGFMDFAEAVRRKLVLEIADRQPDGQGERLAGSANAVEVAMSGSPAAVMVQVSDRVAPPCDIGERRWRQRYGGG
jgi:hypothetical protein